MVYYYSLHAVMLVRGRHNPEPSSETPGLDSHDRLTRGRGLNGCILNLYMALGFTQHRSLQLHTISGSLAPKRTFRTTAQKALLMQFRRQTRSSGGPPGIAMGSEAWNRAARGVSPVAVDGCSGDSGSESSVRGCPQQSPRTDATCSPSQIKGQDSHSVASRARSPHATHGGHAPGLPCTMATNGVLLSPGAGCHKTTVGPVAAAIQFPGSCQGAARSFSERCAPGRRAATGGETEGWPPA